MWRKKHIDLAKETSTHEICSVFLGMMKYLSVICFLLVFSAHIGALDFEEMLDSAVDRDPRLTRAQLSLESQQIRIQKREASEKLKLSFSLSGPSYTFNPSTSSVHTAGIGATASASLGNPYFSSVSLNLNTPSFLSWPPELRGTLSVSQPLNSLLGWQPTTALKMDERIDLEKAQLSLLLERLTIKRDLIGEIKGAINKQLKITGIENRIDEVREADDRSKKMGIFKEGSYQAVSSQLSIEELTEEKQIEEEELDYIKTLLSERIGVEQFIIPEKLPEIPLVPPALSEERSNPAVYFAERDFALVEEQYKETAYSRYPDLSVSSSFSMQDLSLSLAFSLSWQLFDSGLFAHSQKEYEKTIEILRLNVSDAKRSFRRAVESMGFSIQNIQFRKNNLERNRKLAALQLSECAVQMEKGLKTEKQCEELKSAIELDNVKYGMQEKIIRLDAYLLWLEKQALMALALQD